MLGYVMVVVVYVVYGVASTTCQDTADWIDGEAREGGAAQP